MRHLAKLCLKWTGWTVIGGILPVKKCIILGAPHTSLWDFFISWLYYFSVGGKPNIIVNKKFFFWPAGPVLRFMGAIPIDTSRGARAVIEILNEFKKRETLHLAIAIEGTRKPVTKWKGGFHTIARAAKVPVYYGIFDWKHKRVGVPDFIELTDDVNGDILRVKQWYKKMDVGGKHPEKFIYGDDID